MDLCAQALEEKYDSLRDKLLSDALMRQLGEAEWQALSEQERQRRLMMLKLKEKQLRKQGNGWVGVKHVNGKSQVRYEAVIWTCADLL